MLVEFSSLSEFCVSEGCGVVSVSSLEVVFCKSKVFFSSAVVLVCVLLSAVAKKKKTLQLPTEEHKPT